MTAAPFVHAVCNAGSERWLIAEVLRGAAGARSAYRRPGLVTFKLGAGTPLPEPPVFARLWGESLGLGRDAGEVLAKVEGLERPLRLHVFARDVGPEGPAPEDAERAAELEQELRGAGGFREGSRAEPGERVLDVVVAGPAELLVGLRTQSFGWRLPGGRIAVELPEEAPSRAFLKLEEALAWSGLEPRAGETAVEIGSAPGGAALALARRGVAVLAIDPAPLDPRVLAYEGPGGARVRPLALHAGEVRKTQLPAGATLLLCDANVAPPLILGTLETFARWLRPSLRAAVLTLKLNDDKMVAAIPRFLARIRAMELVPHATQLPSNRREICVVARPAEPERGKLDQGG